MSHILQHTPPELEGKQFARWTITKLLGGGGFAWVFKAKEQTLGLDVAIKVLKPSMDDGAYPGGVEERFLLEAKMTASLKNDHTIKIHEFDSTVVDGQRYLYIAMEYIEGMTLHEHLMLYGSLSPLEVVLIVKQIAYSLYDAHNVKGGGFIHRDLKPVNVMVFQKLFSPALHIKVLDYGIGKALEKNTEWDQNLTSDIESLLTPRFAAPEQANPYASRDLIGPHTDLYALGVLAYNCLTGEHPYPDDITDPVAISLLILRDENITLPEPYASSPLAPIIHKLLEKDIAKRYANCADLLRDLEQLELTSAPKQSAPEARPLRPTPAPEQRSKKRSEPLAQATRRDLPGPEGGEDTQLLEGEPAGLEEDRRSGHTMPLEDAQILHARDATGALVQDTAILGDVPFDPLDDRKTNAWDAIRRDDDSRYSDTGERLAVSSEQASKDQGALATRKNPAKQKRSALLIPLMVLSAFLVGVAGYIRMTSPSNGETDAVTSSPSPDAIAAQKERDAAIMTTPLTTPAPTMADKHNGVIEPAGTTSPAEVAGSSPGDATTPKQEKFADPKKAPVKKVAVKKEPTPAVVKKKASVKVEEPKVTTPRDEAHKEKVAKKATPPEKKPAVEPEKETTPEEKPKKTNTFFGVE